MFFLMFLIVNNKKNDVGILKFNGNYIVET